MATAMPKPQLRCRMDRRLVKVLKAVAQLRDLPLGELLEVMAYEVFAGRLPFDDAGLAQVRELMVIYGAAPAAPAASALEE